MQRRELITLLGGVTAAWPLAAGAQQPQRMRRIGILINRAPDDQEMQTAVAEFLQGLQELGWSVGRNVRIDYRYSGGDNERYGRRAAELVALAPDVILTTGSVPVRPLLQEIRSVPVVFVAINDPVASGLVASLAQPGANITGFAAQEYSIAGKWLELLKEIAPAVTRVGVLRDPTVPGGTGQFGAIQVVAPLFGVEVIPLDVREADGIERAVAAFARAPNGGLITIGGARASVHRDLIIALATRHKLPAVQPSGFVQRGGLISYGSVQTDVHRRAAGYVDRILKGEKPADLPVQLPTRYRTVLNMKTAKALGLDVPTSILLRADEVIE